MANINRRQESAVFSNGVKGSSRQSAGRPFVEEGRSSPVMDPGKHIFTQDAEIAQNNFTFSVFPLSLPRALRYIRFSATRSIKKTLDF